MANFGHCTTTINVWESIREKHLAQLVGEGACQPDIFTKYRLGCDNDNREAAVISNKF